MRGSHVCTGNRPDFTDSASTTRPIATVSGPLPLAAPASAARFTVPITPYTMDTPISSTVDVSRFTSTNMRPPARRDHDPVMVIRP